MAEFPKPNIVRVFRCPSDHLINLTCFDLLHRHQEDNGGAAALLWTNSLRATIIFGPWVPKCVKWEHIPTHLPSQPLKDKGNVEIRSSFESFKSLRDDFIKIGRQGRCRIHCTIFFRRDSNPLRPSVSLNVVSRIGIPTIWKPGIEFKNIFKY